MACRQVVHAGAAESTQWLYPRVGRSVDSLVGSSQPVLLLDSERAAPSAIDRYVLGDELGRGGMGVVYDAYDPTLDRRVALKVLIGGRFVDEAAVQRFTSEARAAASLDHRNIVEVMELGTVDGQPYYTMRKVEGPSLAQLLSEHGPLPVDEAVRVVTAVAWAVAYAHARGVVHRDLKPANVLTDGEPAVVDFGLAKLMDADGTLTRSHGVLGTPGYVAPEVARAEPDIDWRLADVFGLGATLYATLTGRPPHAAVDLRRRLDAAALGDHTPLRTLRPDLPRTLDSVVERALRSEPGARYASARELAEDLERFSRGAAVLARPEPRIQRWGRWLWRRRVAVAASGTLVGVAAIVVGGPPLMEARARAVREARAEASWSVVASRMEADPAHADGLFEAFVNSEEARGTRVVTEALLERGAGRARSPRGWGNTSEHTPPELEELTAALLEAPDEDLRIRALWRIAEWARLEGNLQILDAVMEGLAPHIEQVPTEARLPLQMDQALHAGRVEEATRVWLEGRAHEPPLLEGYADPRRLGQAGYTAGHATAWKFDYATVTRFAMGEPLRVVGSVDDEVFVLDSGAGLPLMASSPLERNMFDAAPIWPAPGQPGGFVGHVVAYTLGPNGVERMAPGSCRSSVSLDLDGDGVAERLMGTRDRTLLRFDGDADPVPGHPWIGEAGSDIEVMATGDLDGDGNDELVVGQGAWSAYDVRVLDVDEHGLHPRARSQRNAISALTLLDDPWGPGRLIVAGEHDTYANTRVFGAEDPAGPPPAIVVRRLVGTELETLWEWRLPRQSQVRAAMSTDLDGDGREEAVVGLDAGGRTFTLVVWATQADHFEVSELAGLQAIGVLEGDRPRILGLHGVMEDATPDASRPLWVLGEGEVPAPVPPRTSHPDLGPPPSPEDAAPWAIASVLRKAGLTEDAARSLERLAATRQGEVATAVSIKAAELWASVGRPHRAAERLGQVANRDPDLRVRAVQAHLDSGEPGLALELAADHSLPASLSARLEVWARAREQTLSLAGDVLHSAWTVREPLAVRTGGKGLELTWMQTERLLAEMPLTWSGGAVALFVDLVAERMDWAGGGSIVLDLGGTSVELRTMLAGGGGVFFLHPGCRLDDAVSERLYTSPRAGAPQDIRVSYRLMWEPDRGQWTCAVRALDFEGTAHWDVRPPQTTIPSKVGVRELGDVFGATMRARVERLELWGVGAGEADTTPLALTRRYLAAGLPGDALSVAPEDAWVERALALGQQRRVRDTITGLQQARERDPEAFEASLPYLLRAERETFATAVREVLGPAHPEAYRRVWSFPLESGGDTQEIEEALFTDLEGTPMTDDPSTRWLLARRAQAMLQRGMLVRGRREAEAWLAEGEGASAALLHQALGALDCEAGERDVARKHGADAIASSSTPFIVRDRLRADPRWADCLPD